MKVVIAEDEYLESEALKKILNQYYQDYLEDIISCTDGEAVVEIVKQVQPEIVFMDIEMPFQDGITASTKIREFNQTVKIVMLTAYSEFDYARKSIKNGVLDYIVKPYSVRTICQLMDKVVNVVQRDMIAKRAAKKLLSILRHEFMIRLIVNDQLSLSQKQEYIQMLDLEHTCFVAVVMKKRRDQIEVQDQVDCMECEFGEYHYVVFYGRDYEQVRSVQMAIGLDQTEMISAVESDWNKIDQMFPGTLSKRPLLADHRSEAQWKETLYDAVVRRNREEALEISKNLIEMLSQRCGGDTKFDFVLMDTFIEIVMNICDFNRQEATQLNQVLEISFSVPYHTDFFRASTEFCGNIDKLIQYLTNSLEQKNHRMVEAAKLFIQENYTRDISLEDIAVSVSISKFYLSRLFKSVTGENIKDFLLKVRIDQAKRLLLAGKTVTETTYEVGFSDPAYFSKCFKKIEGCSPGGFIGR